MNVYTFRYYRGVRFVAPWRSAPAVYARCMTCGRAWDDDKSTGLTPVPSGRCPFEGFRGHGVRSKAGAA
jgi:hypothetical protein